MENKLQERIFNEFKDKSVFKFSQDISFDYLDTIFERNVYPHKEDLQSLEVFNEKLPLNQSNPMDIMSLLHRYGSPNTVATIGGRYFGFVCGSSLPIGIATKNIATYWDQAPAMNVLSPIGSRLESVVENWLKDLFNLPEKTSAGFVSGSSVANLCSLAAARYRILKNNDWDINLKGLFGAPRLRIVTGKETHSTILKAIAILGIGKENVEFVDVDDQGRIKVESLPVLDEKTILVLQAGNVNSGSFDDFGKLCDIAKKSKAWVHIDGAFGLWAASVDKLKYLTKGIEKANSWAVDGHKTLNTPYDSGIVLCDDTDALTSALHMSGSYIIESSKRDGMFYTPEMSRRSRIVELWATMKYLGKSGINEMVFSMHENAKFFAELISKEKGFYVENDVVFNQVVVSCVNDEVTLKVLKAIQNQRVCWLGGSFWKGKHVIRVSFCSWATTQEDIKLSVKSFVMSLKKAVGCKICTSCQKKSFCKAV